MRQMKKHEPKFKVGDKVKNIWNENVYTVTSVIDTGYMLDDRYLPFDDEMCWVLADKPEKPESRPEPTRKFNIGDIVQRKDGCCFQYRITGYDGDDYVAIDTFKLERGLKSQSDIIKIGRNDNEYELVKKAESKVQPIIIPKFKVGDRVKRKVVDPHNPTTKFVYTVIEIEDDIYHKYCLDHDDHESWIPISAQDELELVNEREHKFILGDIVVRVKHGVYGERYFIQRIDDDCYIAYPYGVGGDLSDKEQKIWYNEENEWELFSNAVKMSIKPEQPPVYKFKIGDIIKHIFSDTPYFVYEIKDNAYHVHQYISGNDEETIPFDDEDMWERVAKKLECPVSLEKINTDIDNIWKNTLINLINDITKRNTASFMYIIDETLRYMDCAAFVDDARGGMRQFVDELKKRLTA